MDPEATMKAYELVYSGVRKEILEGTLRPGEKLTQAALARRWSTSRTPIRRALKQLELEGLVLRRGVDVSVVGMSADHVFAIHQVQALLESYAAVCASTHMDASDYAYLEEVLADADCQVERGEYSSLESCNRRFHLGIYRRCGHGFLLEMVQSFWDKYPALCLGIPHGVVIRSQRDHYRILESLIAGNSERIQQLMTAHILSTGMLVMSPDD